MAPPAPGRRFAATRRVRLGDVTPDGHVRLDALARYLQDVAADDVIDAGIDGEAGWVVRRSTVELNVRPRYQEMIDLVTWCSGTGAAWAERRTTIGVGGGTVIEASSLWVCMDPVSMRPAPLAERFFAVYGPSSKSRSVRSTLRLSASAPGGAETTAWPLRSADFDVLGHVNNAIAWAALEQSAGTIASGRSIVQAEVEYRRPIEGREEMTVLSTSGSGLVRSWILDGTGQTAITAALSLSSAEPGSTTDLRATDRRATDLRA